MFSSGPTSPGLRSKAWAKSTKRIASSSLGEIGRERSPSYTKSSDVAKSLNVV